MKDRILYILLFCSFVSFGQSKMLLASIQQASGGGGNPNPEEYDFANVIAPSPNETNALTELSVEAGTMNTFANSANTNSIGGGSFMLEMVGSGAESRMVDLFFNLVADTNYEIVVTYELVSGSGYFNNWDGFTFYTDDTFTTTTGQFLSLSSGEQQVTRWARTNTASTAWRFRTYVGASSSINISELSIKEAQ